jgi:hypothetical protein
MQKVRKKDYIVSLPNLIEPPWFWCGRRVHRCSLITGRSPTLIPVPFLLTNIKQQKLLQNQTHMKSIQKKNFMKKNVFFWIEIKRKVGFFLSLSSLFKKKKMTKTSQITHTNPITNLCLSLLQPLLSTFPTKQRFPTVFSRAKVVKIRSNFRIKPLVFVFLRFSVQTMRLWTPVSSLKYQDQTISYLSVLSIIYLTLRCHSWTEVENTSTYQPNSFKV